VARNILADPVKYNEAILGMQPEKYAQTINKPSTWGGAIELSVLAQEFNVEICSIDVETGRMDQFEPEGGGFAGRCFVLYSGQ
jgi:ubiquitin thioesterase OTU1